VKIGKWEWGLVPDEYQPDQPWSQMTRMRRWLFFLMSAGVLIWALLLLFLIAHQFRGS
jgi:hypothetical protein